MNQYGPEPGLYVCWLTRRGAEQFERRIMNIPSASRLGWTPYRIRILYRSSLAWTAFVKVRDFRKWLGPRYRLRITKWPSRLGMRCGFIERIPTLMERLLS